MAKVKNALEMKPTVLRQGMPKAERSGLYGVEQDLFEAPIDREIPAIVMLRISDHITKEGAGVTYPEVSLAHIEPVWDDDARFELQGLLKAAYKERTNQDQLDFSGIETSAADAKGENA